jgi:hypothetical protein
MSNEQIESSQVIVHFIEAQEKALNAVENRGSRQTILTDMDSDGEKDALVLYTLESFGGSNLWLDYAAIFLKKNGVLEYESNITIGGKNRRAIMGIEKVAVGRIILGTQEYSPKDASCCPSKKAKLQVIFQDKRLMTKLVH